MTDNLRDRIAAALAVHRSYGNDCECGWVDDTGLYKQFTGHEQHVADAVIAELGLRYEYENGQILYHPKPKAASGNGNWRWRVSSDLIPYEG